MPSARFSRLEITGRHPMPRVAQVAAQIVRDRDALTAAAAKAQGATVEATDAALRELCAFVFAARQGRAAPAGEDVLELSEGARNVAAYLDEGGLAAPRDLGVVPMEAFRSLITASTAVT